MFVNPHYSLLRNALVAGTALFLIFVGLIYFVKSDQKVIEITTMKSVRGTVHRIPNTFYYTIGNTIVMEAPNLDAYEGSEVVITGISREHGRIVHYKKIEMLSNSH